MDYEGGQHMADYYLVVEAIPQVVASAFVVASVIVGDIILVRIVLNVVSFPFLIVLGIVQTYRVWIVWDRNLVTIIFPALCTCAYIGARTSRSSLLIVTWC